MMLRLYQNINVYVNDKDFRGACATPNGPRAEPIRRMIKSTGGKEIEAEAGSQNQ